MKILMISHRLPWPPTSGNNKAMYNLLRSLAGRHQVTFVAPSDELTTSDAAARVGQYCQRVVTVRVQNRIAAIRRSRARYAKWVARLVLGRVPVYILNNEHPEIGPEVTRVARQGGFDIVQAATMESHSYLRFAQQAAPCVLGPMDDTIESARTSMLHAPRGKVRLMWYFRYRARRHYQPMACRQCEWSLFFSERDAARMSRRVPGLRTRLLPVAIETDSERPTSLADPLQVQERNSIIFVGGLGSNFNVDSVLYFHDHMLPAIRAAIPETKFYIVGHSPPKRVLKLADPDRVIVTGAVPDVRPYIERAAVFVAPIRAGTGIPTKLIEAMSLGKACVATSAAADSVWGLNDGVVEVADEPEAFSAHVTRLLLDDAGRIQAGQRARQLFEDSYAFQAVMPKTLAVYEEIERGLYDANRK